MCERGLAKLTPEIAHVRDPDDHRRERHQRSPEKTLQVSKLSQTVFENRLGMLSRLQWCGRDRIRAETRLLVDRSEIVYRQGRWGRTVETSDRVQDVDCFLFFTLAEQILGRFTEIEDDKSEEEDEQGDGPERDQQVSPAHVTPLGTTRRASRRDHARRKTGVASVFGYKPVRDSARDDNADGLPERQERKEVSFVLRQEFEGDGGVDRDLTAETESGERGHGADCVIVVHGGSLQGL